MSSLTDAATRSVAHNVAPGTYPLKIGADTHLEIHVEHAGHEGERALHQLRVQVVQGTDAWIAPDSSVTVLAPAPRYTHPSQEPADHSLAQRATRFARLDIHGTELSSVAAWTWAYAFVTLWPEEEMAVVKRAPGSAWAEEWLRAGLAHPHPTSVQDGTWRQGGDLLLSRAAFWQGAGPLGAQVWVPALGDDAAPCAVPMVHVGYGHAAPPSSLALGVQRPLRPAKLGAWDAASALPDTPVYRRYIPALRQTLTFRLASATRDEDVDLVHKWHATDRVKTGWRQDLPRDEHKSYLAAIEASSDTMALIGEWDGEPFGYVEIYYAKESNLRDHYDAGDFDRGFHALVGEERFRGPHRVRSWMGAVIHLLFLLDPRTMRVVSEPRASNTKMVSYECLCGGHVEKVRPIPHAADRLSAQARCARVDPA